MQSSRPLPRRPAARSLTVFLAAAAAVLLLSACRVEGNVEVNDDGSGEATLTLDFSVAFLDFVYAGDPEIDSRGEACELMLADLQSEAGFGDATEELTVETTMTDDGTTCSEIVSRSWGAGEVPFDMADSLGRNDQGGWWFRLEQDAGLAEDLVGTGTGDGDGDGDDAFMLDELLSLFDEELRLEWKTVLPGQPGDTDADSVAYDTSTGRSTFTWSRGLADLPPSDVYAETFGDGSAVSEEGYASTTTLPDDGRGPTLSDDSGAILTEESGLVGTEPSSDPEADLPALVDDESNGLSVAIVLWGVAIAVAALLLGLALGRRWGRRSAGAESVG